MDLIYKLSIFQYLQKFQGYFAREYKDLDSKNTQLSQSPTTNIFKEMSQEGTLKEGLSKGNTSEKDEIPSFLLISNPAKLQKLILCLESYNPIVLPKVKNVDMYLFRLKKGGNLLIKDIFEFVKIIKVFLKLKKDDNIREGFLREYLDNFIFSEDITRLVNIFNDKAEIREGISEILDNLKKGLESKLKQKQYLMQKELNKPNLQEFLVDRNLHLIDNDVAFLLRAGFSKVLGGKIVQRSEKGYFFVVPLGIEKLQNEINLLNNLIQDELLKLAKIYSGILKKEYLFLRFINKEFDFLDKAVARSSFAKDNNYEFIFANTHNKFILENFKHPSIKNCKAMSLDFDKNLVLVTGVNAGGKTMLLKSVLSAAFFAKYFIPCSINSAKSQIPFIKNIAAIMQDPQNVSNDISTFSGRIKEFSQMLFKKEILLGIDEIEIGTDANEAAMLYKVLLEHLIKNNAKVIVTTHHKQLAALLADNKHVKMIAATYDIENEKPTFEFIDGVGKSYALLCAKNYGIPINFIKEAQILMGAEANRLENLIDTSNAQITINKQKELLLDSKITECEQKIKHLEKIEQALKEKFERQMIENSREHNKTIKEMRMLIKSNSEFGKQAHRLLNKLHTEKSPEKKGKLDKLDLWKNLESISEISSNLQDLEPKSTKEIFRQNEYVMYGNQMVEIIEISSNICTIIFENGLKLTKISTDQLQKISKNAREKPIRTNINILAKAKAMQKLSIIGMNKEEALEAVEDFLQNAILAKFSEVLVVHGFGSGILRAAITKYLREAKFIQGFKDADKSSGGSAAKIIYL